jgi:hypothetical protein
MIHALPWRARPEERFEKGPKPLECSQCHESNFHVALELALEPLDDIEVKIQQMRDAQVTR